MNPSRAERYIIWFLPLFALIGMMAFPQKAQGQTLFKVMAGSQIKVSGTSNLHDWTMVAHKFTGGGDFQVKNGQLQKINGLNFTLPVLNLKSKEDPMDSRAAGFRRGGSCLAGPR